MGLVPYNVEPDPQALAEILALLQAAFAYMDGRIDPPSSLTRMTIKDLEKHAKRRELWAIGGPVLGTVTLTPKSDCLYIGKLAVAPSATGRGHARHLIEHAADLATSLNLPCLRLQTRVELTQNHRTFEHLGFVKTGSTAHDGYDHPTSITMERQLS